MVGHAALGKIVGTDLFGTVAGADLAAAQLRFRVVGLLLLDIVELGAQQGEGLCLVLKLRLFRLAVDHDPGGIVGQTHGGIGGVDALAAVSGGAHHVDADILFIDDHVHILRLRHDRNGDGGGVDPAAGLGFRHALDAVHAAFIFQAGISALARDHEGDLLHAADADLVRADGFHLPAPALRVLHIQAVHLGREQGCLVSARAGADLHDHVFIVVGVLRQEKDLQLLLQLFDAFFRLRVLFLEKLPHLFVVFLFQHGKAVLFVLLCLLVFPVRLHKRGQVALLLHQRAETLLIGRHVRLVQFIHDLLIPMKQVFQSVKHLSQSPFHPLKSIP